MPVANPLLSTGFDPRMLRIVARTSYGFNVDFLQKAYKLGVDGYLQQQMSVSTTQDDSVVTGLLQRVAPRVLITNRVTLLRLKDDYLSQRQLEDAKLIRALYSSNQLLERMVEFWTDHFNIYSSKVGGALRIIDEQLMRKYALTTFPNILSNSMHSPAMLRYLDNDPNSGGAPNQNYARELLELHTMGVNGGYTQTDVLKVAKAFTGWTWNMDSNSAKYGQFYFNPYDHDNTEKGILGHKLPANGFMNDGILVHKILAYHPSTIRYISTKMLKFFLTYTPSEAQIQAVMKVYNKTGGSIPAMLTEILVNNDLTNAPLKYKRPMHMMVSALRALTPTVNNVTGFKDNYLSSAGHLPYDWPPPNGYPDAVGYWAGFILPRWNFALDLMSLQASGLKINEAYFQQLAATQTPESLVKLINRNILGYEMSVDDQASLLKFLKVRPLSHKTVRCAYALAMASPMFQYY